MLTPIRTYNLVTRSKMPKHDYGFRVIKGIKKVAPKRIARCPNSKIQSGEGTWTSYNYEPQEKSDLTSPTFSGMSYSFNNFYLTNFLSRIHFLGRRNSGNLFLGSSNPGGRSCWVRGSPQLWFGRCLGAKFQPARGGVGAGSNGLGII